jgi:hypothetical protein
MSLHADESAVPRQRSREQPSRPAEGKKPATISSRAFLDRKSPDCIANRAQGRG